MPDPTTPPPLPHAGTDRELEYARILLDEGDSEVKRRMMIGAIVVVLAHVGILAFHWTKKAFVPVVEVRRVVKNVKYVPQIQPPDTPPPPPETPVIEPPKIALPDKTPDAPEEVKQVEQEIVEFINPNAVVMAAPPAPGPPPPPSGPVMAGVDVPEPELLKRVEPNYPRAARAVGATGEVTMSVIIDETGNVTEMRVLRVRPGPGLGFEEEARNAVGQWKYKPATFNGQKVAVKHRFTVIFKLQ